MDGSERGATLTARVTPGLALGSFSAGPNLIYAFILAHYPEPPSLSRDEHLTPEGTGSKFPRIRPVADSGAARSDPRGVRAGERD